MVIKRGFQDDITEFMKHYHLVSTKYYIPTLNISFNDDLDKCENRNEEKVHLEKKVYVYIEFFFFLVYEMLLLVLSSRRNKIEWLI